MEELIRAKRIETSTKYRVLVNYLKTMVKQNTVYIDKEKIELILNVLEEKTKEEVE